MKDVRSKAVSSTKLAGIGALLWLAAVLWNVTDLRALAWSSALLTFAALVLFPLLIELMDEPEEMIAAKGRLNVIRWLQLPAAALLVAACAQSAGWLATALAAPWIIVTWLLAWIGAARIFHRGLRPQWMLCRDAGLLFMAVGGAWTLADRLGLHPLGFGTDIVQLTAVHFHVAGLVLPLVTSLVLREFPESRVATASGWGVLAGVPLVAIGITSTQFGYGHAAEFFAALVLAPSAMIVAVFQLGLARQSRWPVSARRLWSVAGVSLVFGMWLALLYAARAYGMPLPWLDIPWMRALHGTANALGFALCSVLGWTFANRHRAL